MNDSDFPDDDEELELEPVDPEIIRMQQERAKRQTRAAEDSVDIDAVYDDQNLADPVDFDTLRQFRFTTRHLLVLTAVLAIFMTIMRRMGGCMGLFVSFCVALGAGWWFVLREETRRLAEIDVRREEFTHKQAARRAVEDGKPLPQYDAKQFEKLNDEWRANDRATPEFRFSFSMKQLMLAFTFAAIMLGFAQLIGGEHATLLLGAVALFGLILQTVGIELPPLVMLGWWLLLVLYILVSLWTMIGGSGPS